VADDDFGKFIEPPEDYDPFGVSKPIPRVEIDGPVAPLLDPRNVALDEPSTPLAKVPYWDRPKQPRDWYWFLGRLGSGLIILGLLMFLFVGYQLWGTGIEEAQSQNRLEDSFAELVARVDESPRPEVTEPVDTTDSTTVPPTVTEPEPVETRAPVPIVEGDPVAIIELPTIGVKKFVVAGVQTADLKKGPGHYPDTPFPGELGNAAIAGHRTTYGAPFGDIDQLQPGDEIRVVTVLGEAVYRVAGTVIVSPEQIEVIGDYGDNRLTLSACHPKFSAAQRIIVWGLLEGPPTPTVARPEDRLTVDLSVAPTTTVTAAPAATTALVTPTADTTPAPTMTAPPTDTATGDGATPDADANRLAGDGDAWPGAVGWGLATAAAAAAAWGAALALDRSRGDRKRGRRLLVYAAASPAVLMCLFLCFTYVDRLLPAY